MMKKFLTDYVLILLVFALGFTLMLFFLDILVYPFGLFLIMIALLARASYLK
jgi:hypothetical protein